MKDELIALAERVEQATGPDREIDEAIALLTGWMKVTLGYDGSVWYDPSKRPHAGPPAYTASLDAARATLPSTPNDYQAIFWWSGHDGEGPEPWRFFFEMRCYDDQRCRAHRAVANTEPLACVAVGIRARAAMEAGE